MSDWTLDERLSDESHPVAHLRLSELRLQDDCNYPWLILIPRVHGASELLDLSREQQSELLAEIDLCGRALKSLFRPDKLNIATLGNRVPQLHVHLIARFRHDPTWPNPVWGVIHALPYTPEALVERVERLQRLLSG